MFAIDDPSAAAERPATPAPGAPGWFQPGNPATNTPGTRVRFFWLNTLQAELLNILAAAGLAPDKGNDGQVIQALRQRFRGQSEIAVYASQLWVCPDGVPFVRIRAWGGGAGGGGSLGANSGGSGGGGGGYREGVVPVTPGATYAITVAAAAGGGATDPANGQPGQTSSFGPLISATGGNPGVAANGALQSIGAAGGSGAGGTFAVAGNPSGTPYAIGSSGQYVAGVGGGSYGPGYTPIGVANAAQPGQPGLFPGGGGNGGLLGGPGGAGAAGLVIMEF